MSGGDPESWARLRLAQGESTALTLELTSSLGATTLTVGQSPGCDWIVREAGVAPVHFSLHWDGSVLRIADVYGAGGVRVDGVLVGAQWRALSGRARVDFGKAAIVVETAASHAIGQASDPTPLPPMSADARRGSVRPIAKATLLGVAPIDATTLPPHLRASVAQDEAEVGAPRGPKATLLGIADSVPPASPSSPPRSSPAPKPGASMPPPKVSASAPPNATLMGIGLGPAAGAGRKVGGGSLGDGDQRTIQGFPLNQAPRDGREAGPSNFPPSSEFRDPRERRSTQQGLPSDLPPPPAGGRLGAGHHEVLGLPAGTPAGSYRPGPPPQGSVPPGAGWHEAPGERQPASREVVPQAVLLDEEPPREGDARRDNRYSDAPTRMRDPSTMESRRPKWRIPWRYVGVGALTAVAYFAWLYLLDNL